MFYFDDKLHIKYSVFTYMHLYAKHIEYSFVLHDVFELDISFSFAKRLQTTISPYFVKGKKSFHDL